MISFVWSSKYPFLCGAGGSENFTAGHVRELQRRGIPCRIITLGHGVDDGRDGFPDIEFLALNDEAELAQLDDTIIYVTYPHAVHTKKQSYAILHCPPPSFAHGDPLYDIDSFSHSKLIATSQYASRLWRNYLQLPASRIPVVYPFAEHAFAEAVRPPRTTDQPVRVLFAGRLTPDKGIYTLLAALHMEQLHDQHFSLTVTEAGKHSDDGQIILAMLQAHPAVEVVPARRTPGAMAELMADHDVVVMPSTAIFWQEAFGIISVEAQYAGCRVVASHSGGLPETDCGGLQLVEPDNPKSLATELASAIQMGALSPANRQFARNHFTVEESVDSLLKIIIQPTPVAEDTRTKLLHGHGGLLPRW